MSYCRFSTDDYQCDLYVYEDSSGGWTTHVAGSRYASDTPIPGLPPKWWMLPAEEAAALHRAQMEWLRAARLEKIHLPHAGASFNDGELEGVIARLIELRAVGYRFPDVVIDALQQEACEDLGNLERKATD